MYIFSYLHLNPTSIFDKKWKENGIKDIEAAEEFLNNYQYSSFIDFSGSNRLESAILDLSLVPKYIQHMKIDFQTCEKMCLSEDSPRSTRRY